MALNKILKAAPEQVQLEEDWDPAMKRVCIAFGNE
jgi:hypothetical protein